jgi:succinoglycan biosynthesis protein ExoL
LPDIVVQSHDSRVADQATQCANDGELLFFCPDVTDASTLKRVQQFIDFGYKVTVFGFRRVRYNAAYQPPWPNVPLGVTSDARYWHRIRALMRAIPALFGHRRSLGRARAFYARNIDQLLLTLFARFIASSRAPIAYEVLDIPPILVQRTPLAMLLRAIERRCLRRIDLLVVSSPAFHRNYFAAVQKYAGTWFLLENKLHPSISSSAAPSRAAVNGGRPWVVGYFGLIRGEATVALIARLAARLQGRVIFKFRGILTTVDQEGFDDMLRRHPNIAYGGPYLPQQDLAGLYRDVDFAWALDLEYTDHNSRWLMPCRFYEAGYFGVPCLAVHGFEVGNAIERQRLGWTFAEPLEETLVRFFERLTVSDYQSTCRRLRAAPRSMFVAGDDVSRLCRMLGSTLKPRRQSPQSD